jgi:SAM-dependent methyltransferase
MIDKARTNVARAGAATVDVRKGLNEALPVESGSVDWVISNCVINLSPEKDKVFGEIARVLKPGGRMLVSDLVVEDLPEWVRRDPALYSSCIAGAISEKEYLDAVARAGLADVEVKDRVVYDAGHLESFVESETETSPTADGPASSESSCGCGSGSIAGAPCGVTAELAGKVRSLMVYARKA